VFILRYIDEVELRQAIGKQPGKIEREIAESCNRLI